MLGLNSRDFKPLSALSVWLNKSCTNFLKGIAQKPLTSVSLVTTLGLAGVHWLTTAVVAPQSAYAYTASVSVSLNRQPRESYDSLVRRAEAVARAAAQRSFDGDILVTDVAVTILGQNEGTIVPVLRLKVSRQAWRSSPDTQSWATYFRDSQALLGLNNPNGQSPTTEPTPTPEVVPTPEPVPPTGETTIPIPGAPIRIIPRPGGAPQPGGVPQPGAAPQPGAGPGGSTTLDIPGARNRIIPNPTNTSPATQPR